MNSTFDDTKVEIKRNVFDYVATLSMSDVNFGNNYSDFVRGMARYRRRATKDVEKLGHDITKSSKE